jgi:hypothetical protein
MFSNNSSQVSSAIQYIEDVFSTYLYTGNGSTQTITNGIDLSTYGGLVWLKERTANYTDGHWLEDTARGVNKVIKTNTTAAQLTISNSVTAFNSNGFSIGANASFSSTDYVSWTFREQAKFFDVVTYTGNGVAGRTIAHSLGSVPGMIIVKNTSAVQGWVVYHRAMDSTSPQNYYMYLNDVDAAILDNAAWNNTQPTSSVFTVGANSFVNGSGQTYVAYIFAHNAGGFGLAGTDNVISCGSFTGNATVTLGYEPQWVLIKNYVGADSWTIMDNMRGMPNPGNDNALLYANTSGAEGAGQGIFPIATGFTTTGFSGLDCIYMAIRRGPMAVPTLGTSVFGLSARSGTGANATVTGGQLDDAVLVKNRGAAVASLFASRLTGTGYLVTSTTAAAVAGGGTILQTNPWDVMDGIKVGTTSTITNASANTFINYLFRRAPSFMDVVCYTGTGSNTTQTHNLGAVPELMIVKGRSGATAWQIYASALANTEYLVLNTTAAKATGATRWNSTTPTSSVFSIGTATEVNTSTATYIAYLFATLTGVSKVGSYTGTGATQTVACGFTAGARFILIKATSTTGNWYVWDTARGIIAGNDPYWLTNSSAAEVTTTDWVDTAVTGFELSNTVGNLANSNGVSYIFLAVA